MSGLNHCPCGTAGAPEDVPVCGAGAAGAAGAGAAGAGAAGAGAGWLLDGAAGAVVAGAGSGAPVSKIEPGRLG
jgi:hypothetical protein